MKLDWKGYYEYTEGNVQKHAPLGAGVYKIGIKQENGNVKVIYVGQTNNLDRRLKEHLDLDSETNMCLVKKRREYHSRFSFALVSSQSNRDGAEKALYDFYQPVCNDSDAIPNGPNIEVNSR